MHSLPACFGIRNMFAFAGFVGVFAASAVRGAAPIDAFTTTPGWVDGETQAEVLTSITVEGSIYSNPTFLTTTATSGVAWLWGQAAANPGGAITAITDNRLDTGVLGAGIGMNFDFGSPLTTTDQIFVFYNAATSPSFYEQPTSVSAFNSGGSMIGSAVTLPTIDAASMVGLLNAVRSDGPTLSDRGIYGIAIDPSDFGATIGDIARINFAGPSGTDFQMVGFASLGAPATSAMWHLTGGGSWGVGSNWNINGVPFGLATTFGPAVTSPSTITLGGDRRTTDLIFDSANPYTISGAETLSVTGDISVLQGSHTIASTLELSGGERTLTSGPGASLTVTGTTLFQGDAAGTLVLDGPGGGSIGAIRDNNDVANELDGTDNIAVIKRGAGTWEIGAASTTGEDYHGGDTTVEAGRLRINGSGVNGEIRSPVISVKDGAFFDTSEFTEYTLQVNQRIVGDGTIDGGSGNLRMSGTAVIAPGDSGPGTLDVSGNMSIVAGLGGSGGGFVFEVSPSTVSGNDKIAVSGSLTTNAGSGAMSVTIVPTGTSLASGQYELITAASVTGSAADFALDNTLQTRFTQSISVDSNSVNLNISGSNAGLTWRGNNATNATLWDVNATNNWTNGASLDVFFDLDNVTFDDTAVATMVEVQGVVTPASVNFSNSTKDFTVSGAGSITGGALNKSGAGRVTISTANTYTGTTTITAGTLHVTNSSALGTTDEGTVVNGGTLDITGTSVGDERVTIQGAGDGGKGAIVTDGFDSLGGGARQISHVAQSGDATIGAFSDQPAGSVFEPNDYRWDLEPASNFPNLNASWQGNGHTLTKVGRGTVSIQRVGDMGGGNINIQKGVMFWQGNTTSSGATVTIGDNSSPYRDAELEETGLAALSTFYDAASTGPGPDGGVHAINLVLQGGAFSHSATSGSQDITVTGSVVGNDVTGDSTIDNQLSAANGNTLAIANGIAGNGDLRIAGDGAGVVELQGNNTYSGRTEVTGILGLAGAGQLSGTPRIELKRDIGLASGNGGSIDASGRTDGRFSLTGQTLAVGGKATAVTGLNVVEVNPSQDARMRYNPNSPDSNVPQSNPGDLFVGPISTSDRTRSVLEFDLSTVTALTGVTDIESVVFEINHSADSSSSATPINIEVYELTQDFVEAEVSGKAASSGVFWAGYTMNGDADPNAGALGAAGALVSVSSGQANIAQTMQFSDNQGGAFESFVENALAGNGSVKLLMKADNSSETSGARYLFRNRERTQSPPPVLRIEFSGTQVDTLTASIVGDFAMDASSTLELDVYNALFSDLLNVSGAAVLNGTLDVSWVAGSSLAVNDTVTVLSAAGGITDNGLSVLGPFAHSIIGNDLVLTFTGIVGLPGDFNGDGIVDAADYTVYRDNVGVDEASDVLNGNGDGGSVGPSDYALWKSNFGRTGVASTAAMSLAVPEPSSVLLVLFGSAAALWATRRN